MAGVIEGYLFELAQALHLPAKRKARILAEVSDHLAEALVQEQERGYSEEEASQRAVHRFGPAKTVARGFLLEAANAETYRAGRVLLATECAMILFSFLRNRTQPRGPWPHDILPPQLTFFVNSASLAFLCALCLSSIVYWKLWRSRTTPLSASSMRLLLTAALFIVFALLVDAICYGIFTFQRAAVVPHSPAPLVLWLFILLESSCILIGSCFVVRAFWQSMLLPQKQTL